MKNVYFWYYFYSKI